MKQKKEGEEDIFCVNVIAEIPLLSDPMDLSEVLKVVDVLLKKLQVNSGKNTA